MKRISFTRFISYAMSLAFILSMYTVAAGQYLDAATHPTFENPLPDPAVIDAKKGGKFSMTMRETTQWLGLYSGGVPSNANKLTTTVWGYGEGRNVTFPGPTIEAMSGQAVTFRWNNDLPRSGHLLPVDVSLHLAHPHGTDAASFYAAGNIPTVVHLHGGHTESPSDGLPEAWYTQKNRYRGRYYVKRDFRYDNDQQAATLWYHDHALGITRLNVYAGLAGFYLLRDQNEVNLINNNVLPSGEYEREIVIQDRMFYSNGELFLPSKTGDPWFGDADGEPLVLPLDPSVVAEFFGDFIIVNGMAWPYMEVEPRKYRIRLLNGSDSRFYVLNFGNDLNWFQIGTDNGLMANAVAIPEAYGTITGPELIIAPGERMDIILDFTGKLGQSFIWNNYGPDAPFGGDVDLNTNRPTHQIMEFRVNKALTGTSASVAVGTSLGTATLPAPPAGPQAANQQLVLFEGADDLGRLQPMLGTFATGSQIWDDAITENPALGATEIWEVFNATMDAHPIHLHLVAFEILGRGAYTAVVTPRDQTQHDGAVGTGADFALTGRSAWRAPEPNERGWKDTHIVYPGEYSQVRATFDRPGRYVWHCHILSHEDHEMMRPFFVGPMSNGRVADEVASIQQNSPNPFTSSTQIRFELKQTENVQLGVFDLNGRMVYQYAERFNAGKHALFWDGFDLEGKQLPRGVYVYRLSGESFEDTKRLIIER